jgi:hypothetical protein
MRRLALFVVLGIALCSSAAEKPRVYITDSKSWQVSGGGGGTADGFGGGGSGGDRPQTAEIIKTFGERCPAVTINNQRDKANYVVLLDHEGGKEAVFKDNKVVVFNRDGDSIMSHSTRTLGNAVKDACAVISTDWPKQAGKAAQAQANDSAPNTTKKSD